MSPRMRRLVPLGAGFADRLGEAEVERAGEELIAAVERPRLQQLLGANHAERVEQLGADDVLAALAAIERQIGHARVIAARQPRDQRRVLVVGMRAGVHRAGGRPQPLSSLDEPGRAAAVDGPDLRGRRSGEDDHGQQQRRPRAETHGHGPESIC